MNGIFGQNRQNIGQNGQDIWKSILPGIFSHLAQQNDWQALGGQNSGQNIGQNSGQPGGPFGGGIFGNAESSPWASNPNLQKLAWVFNEWLGPSIKKSPAGGFFSKLGEHHGSQSGRK